MGAATQMKQPPRNEEEIGEVLTASDASHILFVSTVTVRSLVAKGQLPIAFKSPSGRIAYFRRSDVERLARERKGAKKAPPR